MPILMEDKSLSPHRPSIKGRLLSIIFAVLLLMNAARLAAQNDTLYFGHFGTNQYLSSNNVSCVIQDHLGYMWYGTQNGLNKFDGYGFTTFLHDPKNENSVASDNITCMSSGENGIVWIGTEGKGLNRYDTYSGEFILYHHQQNDPSSLSSDSITALFTDSTGILWIGTHDGGLNVFSPKTGNFKTYHSLRQNSNSLSSDHITSIGSNGSRMLWIGTADAGMNAFDRHTGHFTVYDYQSTTSNSISSNEIRDIYVDKGGMIWIATADGLNKFDPVTRRFLIYRHDVTNPFSIISNDVTSVFQDKYGKIWVGTADKGVNVYYEETNKFLAYIHDNSQLNSLSSNKINSISQGRSGMMWIATSDGGLNAFNPKSLKFNLLNPFAAKYNHDHAACITSLTESPNGILWIGTVDDGITAYNTTDKSITSFMQLGKLKINSTMIDHNGMLWVGSDQGLNTVDPVTKRTTVINFAAGDPAHRNIPVTALVETQTNSMFIGTANGLYIFKPEKSTTVLYRHDDNDPSSIAGNVITSMAEDEDGIIWLALWGEGLSAYNPSSGKFSDYRYDSGDINSISSNYVKSICIDTHGNILAGTQDGGLNILNKKTNRFTCYSTADGLPGNTVNSILEDDRSNLWIGTEYGICRLNFDSAGILHSRLYDMKDGLPTPQFDNGASIKTAEGRMLFSCCKGLMSFNPGNINPNKYQPPVVITDFRLFYKPVVPGDDSKILKTSISVTKELQLSYNQNVFSFEFTAISFINPEKNRYAFKLDPFDKDWNYTDYKNRVATYTNLPPGDYVFHVKASNNDDVWNEEGTSIRIRITQPFWKSQWFIWSMILFLMALIYIIISLRSRTLRKQKLLLEKAVDDRTNELRQEKNKAEESEKFKQQFVANMSHEIRTPINAVMGMTHLVLDGELDSKQRNYMNAIRHSSENLLVILDDILNLSKLESGKIELDHIPFRLSDQLQILHETLYLAAKQKSLSLIVPPGENFHDILIGDPVRLSQVLINLAGNAIKFTEKGYVKVSCRTEQAGNELLRLIFTVSDSGIGIPEENLNRIFSSFIQGSPAISRQYGGTGLGLTISKQLIEMQGGALTVSSLPGEGSEFTFSIEYEVGNEQLLAHFLEEKNSPDTDSLSGIRILVAEDNLYNQVVTVDTLRKLIENVTVETASNGEEVLKWLRQKEFDLVLMDIQMPGMDGCEVTTIIRNQMPAPVSRIPIIAVTASAIKSELKKCTDAGMNGFLTKPFVRVELLRQIAQHYHRTTDSDNNNPKISSMSSECKYTDLTDLKMLTDCDEDQMRHYIDLFLASVSDHIVILKKSIVKYDEAAIKKSIHALKSQVQLMGIRLLDPIIADIENATSGKGGEEYISGKIDQLVYICNMASAELTRTPDQQVPI
jgi:signal transduction histidine kinase/ligand-binding sensor domain-containing protein/CheY-like chemotaxis protein